MRRLAMLGLVFVAAILSCGKDVTGPLGAAARYARGLAFDPIFPPAFQAAGGSSSGVVDFTSVHVVLHHSDGTVALDTTINFPAGQDSLTVDLTVKLLDNAPSTGEPMSLDLGYLNSAGVVVFQGGPVSVTAAPPATPGTPNPPVKVPVTYTGPGASAVAVAISPRSLTVNAGGTFSFTAVAKDASGNTLPAPIIWNSLDPAIATITSAAAGNGVAASTRGTARIIAQLFSGASDTVLVNVLLPASQIIAQSGGAQSGIVGTNLTNPLVVKVAATDGVGVAGAAVNFAVASGGGSVSNAAVISDANGLAQTTFKLGTGTGVQSVTATAGSLTNSPLTFSDTAKAATATKLVVSTQPVNGVAGTALAAIVVTAEDNNGNVANAFTGAVSMAFGTNTPGATLGGTTTVNAVAGVATFSTLTVNKNGSAFTLVASSTGLTSATTSAFDVAVGAPKQLVFTVQPTGNIANVAMTPAIVVNAQDSQGNPTPSFTGAVTLGIATNPSSATLGGTLAVTAVSGAATFSGISVSAAGTGYALSASATGLTSATSALFTAGSGVATTLALSSGGGQSANINSALPLPITVLVTDAGSNPVAGKTVNFAVVTGGGSVLPTSGVSNASGIVQTNWTLGPTVGAQSISATSAGLAGSPLTINATGTVASAFSKTWTGATNNQWATASNWSPAGVPAATDSVLIPVSANNPQLAATATINGITINAGATLTLTSGAVTLNDNGGLDATGGILGTGAVVVNGLVPRSIRGTMAATTLTLFGVYTQNGTLAVVGNVLINSGGSLVMNGNVTTVTGNFSVAATGTLTMTNAADVLTVGGAVSFGGASESGLLTNGLITLSGNFFQTNTATSFAASGSHQVVFAGAGAQSINMTNPGPSTFNKLTSGNSIGVALLTNVVTASDLTTAGPITGAFGLTIGGQLIDPLAGVAVAAISFSGGPNPVSASTSTINTNVTFNGASTLLANLTVNGGVNVNSAAGVLTIGAHTLNVNGTLNVQNNATLVMSLPADVVNVNGNATFSGGASTLVKGNLIITGNFTQSVTSNAFAAGALHHTIFTGAAPTISFSSPGASFFGQLALEASGAVTFTSNVQTQSDVWLKTGLPSMTVTNGGASVLIGGGLYDTTGGRWQASNTTMTNGGALPRSLNTNLTISGPTVLADSVKLLGATNSLTIGSGNFNLNGHYVKVPGAFATLGAGTLTMQSAHDSLIVKGNASFNGGSTAGQLTNGYLEFDGANFTQGVTATAFSADAPHITWFWGSLQQSVAFANSGAALSHFGNLYLQDTATVLNSNMYLNGQLQSGGQPSFHIEAGVDQLVTSNGSNGRNFVFDNVRWKIAGVDGNGLFPSLDNITFQNISATTLPQFDYEYSVKTNLSIPGFTFLTTPTGGGSYIKIVGPDTLTLSSTSPASSGGFVNLSGGGAIVGWSNTDTWLGSVSTAWATAGNWSGGVPTAASDVVIGSGSFQPSTGAAITVHSMSVLTGAVLSVTGGALTVSGSITVGAGAQISIAGAFGIVANGDVVTDTTSTTGITSCAGGQAINLQAGTHNITGKFCNLSIFGTATATGPIQVVGSGLAGALLPGTGGNLIFNGHRVDVTQYSAVGGSGLITMTNTLDTLYLHSGSTATPNFNGGAETGLMTAGAIIDRAAIVDITGLGLDASGTQSFIVDTSFFQTLSFGGAVPGHGFNNLTMKGTASKGFSGDQWITGTLLFDATMVGPGNVQGSYNIHVNTLIDNSTGINGGAFQGSTALHITGSTPFNRDTLIVNTLYFDHGQTVALAHNLVTNYMVVDSNSTLSLNGHTVNLQGNYFYTQNGGMLQMTNAADSLVANQLYFNGGSTSGLMTKGAINVSGSVFGLLYQGFSSGHIAAATASATAFAPSGTRVWFNPPFGADVAFANPGSGGTGSHFWLVQATNGNPITMQSNVVIDSLLKGDVFGDTWQSDSAAQNVARTIITAGVYNSNFADTLTLKAVNIFLSDGAAASLFNYVKWTNFPTISSGALFTQNRTTSIPTVDFHVYTGTSFSGTGAFGSNVGSATLTFGLNITGGSGTCVSNTLSVGQTCK